MTKIKILDKIWNAIWIKCPGCNHEISFSTLGDEYGIEVNVESKGQVHIPGMLHFWNGCRNPLCKWSKVKDET